MHTASDSHNLSGIFFFQQFQQFFEEHIRTPCRLENVRMSKVSKELFQKRPEIMPANWQTANLYSKLRIIRIIT